MKCEICGREGFKALGNHLRQAHGVTCDEYRDEFGILRITPLTEPDLSARLSACAKRRVADESYKEELIERLAAFAGKTSGGAGMGKTQRKRIVERNAARADRLLKEKAKKIIEHVQTNGCMSRVHRSTNTCPKTLRSVIAKGLIPEPIIAASNEAIASNKTKLNERRKEANRRRQLERWQDAAFRAKERERRNKKRRAAMPGFPMEFTFRSPEELAAYFGSERIQCLLCGKRFKVIGTHLKSVHQVEPDAYRERYGIPWTYGLSCKETSQLHAATAQRNIESGKWINDGRSLRLRIGNPQRQRPRAPVRDVLSARNLDKINRRAKP